MIDFDVLVLGPCAQIFGRPIFVFPRVSQPGQPGYWSTGDYRIQNVDIQTMEGILSEQTLTMGVRLATFPVPPVPQDQVFVPAHRGQPAAGPFWIDDTDDDAQGHSVWSLKDCDADEQNVSAGPAPP